MFPSQDASAGIRISVLNCRVPGNAHGGRKDAIRFSPFATSSQPGRVAVDDQAHNFLRLARHGGWDREAEDPTQAKRRLPPHRAQTPRSSGTPAWMGHPPIP